MNISIEVHYSSGGSRALRKGSFPLRGRKPEYVALEFWKQIKKDHSQHAELEQIIVDGDQDITQLVLDLEKEKRIKIMNEDNLPF
jgi:hypothetical protein